MAEMLLAFDPGGATGWSLWLLDEDNPLQRVEYGLIQGGEDGFLDWAEQHLGQLRPDIIVCERFNPDLGTGDGRKSYEPMLIQGALKAICRALGIEVIWQDIGMKSLCRDDVLKRSGLWVEGSDVGWEDGRDVNDSAIHALAWAKVSDHEPSVRCYWPEDPITDYDV